MERKRERGREGAGEGEGKTERVKGWTDTAAATRSAVIHLHNCGNTSESALDCRS